MQIEQEQEIFLTRLRFLKPPLEVVQRRLILSISPSFLPTRENGPNFGFTMHASTTVWKLLLSLQVQLSFFSFLTQLS